MPRVTASGRPAVRRHEAASSEHDEKSPPSSSAPASPRKVPHFALPTQSSLLHSDVHGRTPRSSRATEQESPSPRGALGRQHADVRKSSRNHTQDLQLSEAQGTVAHLKEELRLMQSDIKRKEAALVETTQELEDLKKRNMILNTTVSAHRQEIRELRAEKNALESISLQSRSLDEISRDTRREGSAGTRAGRARNNQRTARLKQENMFLLAAIQRYDSTVMSLREVISVISAQTIKSGESNTFLEVPAQHKLREVLESLMRVKDNQVQNKPCHAFA